jgi:hypothetical protein
MAENKPNHEGNNGCKEIFERGAMSEHLVGVWERCPPGQESLAVGMA